MPLPIIVLAIIFGSILLSLKLILDYRKDSPPALGDGSGRDPGNLTSGELKRLVRDAVDESIRPLVQRMEDLEQTLLVSAGQRRAELGPAPPEPSRSARAALEPANPVTEPTRNNA